MNNKMSDSLKLFGLSEKIIKCQQGEYKSPWIIFNEAKNHFAFPPCFIPIWENNSIPSYIGFWYREFYLLKQPSFVVMDIENNRILEEISRTEEQLFSYILINAIVSNDQVTEEVRRFGDLIGLHNLDEIDNLTIEFGDSIKDFINLPCYQKKTPLEVVSVVQHYDGGFPNDENKSHEASSFELGQNFDIRNSPPWIKSSSNESNQALFQNYLKSNDFRSAWLTLNSTGWHIPDAIKACEELIIRTDDKKHKAILNNWISTSAQFDDECY